MNWAVKKHGRDGMNLQLYQNYLFPMYRIRDCAEVIILVNGLKSQFLK